MATKRDRARQRQLLLDDPETPAYIKAELLKEDRLDGRRRRTPSRVDPAKAAEEFTAELKAWLTDYVVPEFGRPGVTADQVWEVWEAEGSKSIKPATAPGLDGSVTVDFRGRPLMLPDGSRPLMNTVRDQVWWATSCFTLWWLGCRFDDLLKVTSSPVDGLPPGHGFVLPGSHPDTCRWGTERVAE